MKTHIDSEKLVERRLVEMVKLNGGMCIKLLSDHTNGLPDRLCIFHGKKVFFVELKTTGQKPRKLQLIMHNAIRRLGFDVFVIDTVAGVERFIRDVIEM